MPPKSGHIPADSQFIRDIERSAIDEFNREHPYEQSFYNDVAGFIAAIDWEADGYWLAVVAVVHLVYFSLIVCFRRVETVQLSVFVSICVVVLASESINTFLHEHWWEFATQDYFDPHGVFLSCLLSGPLLALGFLQVSSPHVRLRWWRRDRSCVHAPAEAVAVVVMGDGGGGGGRGGGGGGGGGGSGGVGGRN
jgi:uncharacterized membrane protein YgcG